MAGTQKITWWVLLLAGGTLWLINWWAARPLFLDEANVVRNLYDLGFIDFFLRPLMHEQYAPPLYLTVAKACGEVFGYGERALRLPAMLGGIMGTYGLWLAARQLRLGWWALLPVALLFVNPTVLRFVGEVKPYATDLGVAALLIAAALRPGKKNLFLWGVAGVIAVWASLPAVFTLAAVGLANLLCTRDRAKSVPSVKTILTAERWKWVLTGLWWALSFALLYVLLLRPSLNNDYLHDYHLRWMIPLPQPDYPWARLFSILESLPKLAFGFTLLAIFFGTATAVVGFTGITRHQKILFAVPLAVVLLSSAFGYYSLMSRLLFFTLPAWWLLAALGSKHIYAWFRPHSYWPYLFVGAWVVVLGGTNVRRHYLTPMTFSDSRRLSTGIEPGYRVLPHTSALPAYDYYQRIHPGGDNEKTAPKVAYLKHQAPPGRFVGLYDVLTAEGYRERMEQDSIWATERGCKVRIEAMHHAARVYYDCE